MRILSTISNPRLVDAYVAALRENNKSAIARCLNLAASRSFDLVLAVQERKALLDAGEPGMAPKPSRRAPKSLRVSSPPEALVSALQDRIRPTSGRLLAAKHVKPPSPANHVLVYEPLRNARAHVDPLPALYRVRMPNTLHYLAGTPESYAFQVGKADSMTLPRNEALALARDLGAIAVPAV